MILLELMELYNIADSNNVKVDCFELENQPCLSIQDDEYNCYIAIDPMQLDSEQQEKEHLAHELGHCCTGAFYSRYSPLSNRGQMEYRATLWQIKKLIPKNEFEEAIKSGIIELWELAEHFEVSEDLMKKAINYYMQYAG